MASKRHLLALVLAAAGTLPAKAADAPAISAVLELFTSQGCSSCPPADALLGTYVNRDDIIALSFPVDYWDRLGWKDTLASPEYTARQYAYAETWNSNRVYTPQLIVNGTADAVGSSKSGVAGLISRERPGFLKRQIRVEASSRDGRTLIRLGAPGGTELERPATVWLLAVRPSAEVDIRRGENGGRILTYWNVVTSMEKAGHWAGNATSLEIPSRAASLPYRTELVVLVQDGETGPMLGAARVAGTSAD